MPSLHGATPGSGVILRSEGVPPSIGLLERAFRQEVVKFHESSGRR